MRVLTALPIHNEAAHVESVLSELLTHTREVLAVDDGSNDATPNLLRGFPQVKVIRHPVNLGYGASLRSAFAFALQHGYDALATIDCDGQHQPSLIAQLVTALTTTSADIVSGSRYLSHHPGDARPPEDRRRINLNITQTLNQLFGWRLTDAFCGFKVYRREALERFDITENGYAMPLQLWVQAYRWNLRIHEEPVPLIYLEEARAFGGALDNPAIRLNHYLDVLRGELERQGLHHLLGRSEASLTP